MDRMDSDGRTTADAARNDPLVQLSLDRLRRRTSMKWRAYPGDVLPLWVAEMDVPLAPAVAAAVHEAIDLGDTGYPYGRAYAEALADFAHERWRWDGLRVEDTAIVPDVMMGVVELLRLVTDPGDAVVVCSPVYPPFYAFVSHDGRQVVEAPLGADLRMDLQSLEEAFVRARGAGRRRVAFLMSNPHNPTGVVHTHEELRAVAELARRHQVRVVSDEIHGPLVLAGAAFTPFLSVPGAENGLAVTSASKAWNLAGLKAAVAFAGPEAAADLRRIPEEVSHGPSHLGVIAHTAALRSGRDWLDDLLNGLDANRRLLGDLVEQHLPGVRYHRPEATYLAWLDCTALGLHDGQADGPGVVSDLAGPARMFRDRARVALSSGHAFGTGGSGCVRLNFATSPTVLREAVERMGKALSDL
ncbi:MalY/PatB family protein [Streptacidiphilus jiangxiensis]|uniref:cysteine-S-conjugate beta-lyase n=1 Tax=Streptacidiphilus jiangxiensis TaxID=235985 RepID=A0A1H7HCT5_STRJI|nr:MalY/PatB family protein [Streptacidiphilus jiangxiensis]SEK48203.1 cystathione beta-lyase [Streptacidiphilus jiangxiensis]